MGPTKSNPIKGADAMPSVTITTTRNPSPTRTSRYIRNRALHGVDLLIPPRPIRAMTGYNLFVREYFRTPNESKCLRSLSSAAADWRILPQENKIEFNQRCESDRQRYRQEMSEWTKLREAMKCPTSPYAVFIKKFWESEKANLDNKTFSDIAKIISKRWKKLTLVRKCPYVHLCASLNKRYQEELVNVRAGKQICLDWKHQIYQSSGNTSDKQNEICDNGSAEANKNPKLENCNQISIESNEGMEMVNDDDRSENEAEGVVVTCEGCQLPPQKRIKLEGENDYINSYFS